MEKRDRTQPYEEKTMDSMASDTVERMSQLSTHHGVRSGSRVFVHIRDHCRKHEGEADLTSWYCFTQPEQSVSWRNYCHATEFVSDGTEVPERVWIFFLAVQQLQTIL